MRLVTIGFVVCGLFGSAHAGKKVKAEVLCGTFVDGAVKAVIPSAKKPKLTDPVACALHMNGTASDTFMGNIHTVRYVIDDKGKKKKVETSGATTDIESDKDVEIVMKPGVADENGEVLFQACEDFDIVAKIGDDRGVYFTKTIHVAQSCPKAKPMKAKAGCYATNEAGDRIDLPAKNKPALEGYTLQCWVMSTDQRFFSGKLKFTGQTDYTTPTTDDTDGHRTGELRTGTYEEGEDESAYSFKLEPDDIVGCPLPFDIKLNLDDENGSRLFSTKISVKQSCKE